MQRYFIDIDDGGQVFRDGEGLLLSGPAEARRAALSALPDLARDLIPDGDTHVLACVVQDGKRRIIYQATLTLSGAWIDGDDSNVARAMAKPLR
jgi:hypothetical protein